MKNFKKQTKNKFPEFFLRNSMSILRQSAFTLIEMLIYVSLMALISLIVAQSVVIVLKSNKDAFAEINIRNSGYSAMEGMLREIYLSESIDQVSSGILQMKQNNGTDIVKFATSSNSVLYFYKGTITPILIGPLTSKNVSVRNLIFTKINTGKSFAVRIQMELQTNVNNQAKNEWFYGTAILRGSY